MPSPPERSRRAPLREAQADLTKARVVEAVAELAGEGRFEHVTMREIAEQAGMSERTLYRHFADRQALLDALADWLSEQMDSGPLEDAAQDASDLPDLARAIFARFDDVAAVARASVLLAPVPGADGPDHLARTERIRGLLARSFPGLSESDLRALVAVVRTLMSQHTWLRMRDEFGLDGQKGGEAVARALETLLADAGRRSR